MSRATPGRPPLTADAARRRLLLLSATRWFPVGLLIPVLTLLPLERGLTVVEVTAVLAVQGLVVLVLELPSGGLADAVGRRPVLVAATTVGVVSSTVFALAASPAAFVVAAALQGVYRSLDSGPLEAWYVDTAHADDPASPVEAGLSRAGVVLGVAIAGGALLSGALVAWDPVAGGSALALPVAVSIGLQVVHLVAIAALVREPRRGPRSLRAAVGAARTTPAVVGSGLALLGRNRVLLALVAVEVFWSVAMVAFESLMPIRLAELLGGEDAAGAVLGPVAALAWVLFAAGSALAGVGSRRIGVARTAVAARVLNGAFVVAMGLAAGPAGLLVAYLAAYAWHGAGNPVHATLLHRQAEASNRTTVLSINSLVTHACASAALLLLGPLAGATSVATAITVAGAVSVVGAVLYLPARRQERALDRTVR